MTKPKFDAAQLWCDIEDLLVPRLRITPIERAVYFHLLRHTRLQGQPTWLIPLSHVARCTLVSPDSVRNAVRTLDQKGVLRILERTDRGHRIEVRLPREIAGCKPSAPNPNAPPPDLETLDFFRDKRLRQAIHLRDGWRCFYCRREIANRKRALDHVVPRCQLGSPMRTPAFLNSYRNLVSACQNCNYHKGAHSAPDFLRKLYREGRLNVWDLRDRLAALKKLARGNLKPVLKGQAGEPLL